MFEDNKISGEGDCERMELGRKQVYMGGKVCRIVGKMWGNRGTRWIRICHQRGTQILQSHSGISFRTLESCLMRHAIQLGSISTAVDI